ncbi:MAG: PQQ-binding-like beta-propeller repeat protein [Acidobacteriota bacterium]
MSDQGAPALYIGIAGTVVALDRATGTELWRSKLKASSNFINVAWESGTLLAATGGELYRLDPATGVLLWHNKLKGLGTGLVTFAGTASQVTVAGERRRQEEATAATVAAASS